MRAANILKTLNSKGEVQLKEAQITANRNERKIIKEERKKKRLLGRSASALKRPVD